ncbi:unnamed protein product [Jaminaea pallidilutea]
MTDKEATSNKIWEVTEQEAAELNQQQQQKKPTYDELQRRCTELQQQLLQQQQSAPTLLPPASLPLLPQQPSVPGTLGRQVTSVPSGPLSSAMIPYAGAAATPTGPKKKNKPGMNPRRARNAAIQAEEDHRRWMERHDSFYQYTSLYARLDTPAQGEPGGSGGRGGHGGRGGRGGRGGHGGQGRPGGPRGPGAPVP